MTARAQDIMADAFGVDAAQISETGDMASVPGWDSLSHMKLVAALEEALGRPLEIMEIVGLVSVPAISQLLEQECQT